MVDFIVPFVIQFSILAALIAGGVWMVRAAVRRTSRSDNRSITIGIVIALATALSVFILVYLSAWAELRQQVTVADIQPHGLLKMRQDFAELRQALSDYAGKHGHYPDSLEQLPELKDREFFDYWHHPYQYTKTPDGYRLVSLGYDGKPGGVGLDADIDSQQDPIWLEPTFSQFLFEARGRWTLFNVAMLASLLAGLTCYITSGSPRSRRDTPVDILLSVAVTTVGAVLISLFLVSIYTIGNHH